MHSFKSRVKLAFGGQMPGLAMLAEVRSLGLLMLATFDPTDAYDLPGFFFGVVAFVAHG